MTNTAFTDWNGNILDIGPLYPFVGWEVLMVILLLVFWIWWHFMQVRMENDADRSAAEELGQRRQPRPRARGRAHAGADVTPLSSRVLRSVRDDRRVLLPLSLIPK